MKISKKAVAATAGIMIASAAVTGCVPAATLYGPPPETPAAVSPDPVPALYGPPPGIPVPVFTPETNEPVDVYGPPLPYEEAEESEIPAEGAGIG